MWRLSWIVSVFVQVDPVPLEEEPALEALRQWIETYTGIAYKQEAAPVLYHRLMQLCYRENIPTLQILYAQLTNGHMESLSLKIAQNVSTTHTHFYRETEAFELMCEHIKTKLSHGGDIRIWSAAASGGQEAYTMAIYLSEALGLAQTCQRIRILGTDINATVIKKAETGLYSREQLKDVPAEMMQTYFMRAGLGQYQILPELKKICTFRRLNLTASDWPFQHQFHVVFCRNVLYYFKKEQQAQIVNTIYRHVVPDGVLFTSVTESLGGLTTPWRKLQPAMYQKLSQKEEL